MRCPKCYSNNISQQRMPTGKIQCGDCGFEILQKEIYNPFVSGDYIKKFIEYEDSTWDDLAREILDFAEDDISEFIYCIFDNIPNGKKEEFFNMVKGDELMDDYIVIEGETGSRTAFKISTAKVYTLEEYINNYSIVNDTYFGKKTRIGMLNNDKFGIKSVKALTLKEFKDILLPYLDNPTIQKALRYSNKDWKYPKMFRSTVMEKYGTCID